MRNFALFLFLQFIIWGNNFSKAQWMQMNGPYGGSISAICISPDENIFVSSFGEGINRSTDNGTSWKTVGLAGQTVFAIAADSNGYIYAGGSQNSGISKSVDGGTTWSYSGLANKGPVITCIAVDKKGNIFAGTDSTGVYRSTDKGNNWTDMMLQPAFLNVSSIFVSKNGTIFAGTNYGVYRSTNVGDSWTNIGLKGFLPGNLFLIVDSNETILAVSSDSVFRSTDNGDTWEKSALPGIVFTSLAITSQNEVYAGTETNLFKSDNAGLTWVPADNGIKGNWINKLASNKEGYVFAGTGSQYSPGTGFYRSTDNGFSWQRIGIPSAIIHAIAADSSGTVFASVDNEGIFFSSDQGSNWVESNTGLLNNQVWSLFVNSKGSIFAGTNNGLFRSTNQGKTWNSTNFTGNSQTVFTIIAGSNDDMFAGAAGGVYHSIDDGQNWTFIGLDKSSVRSLVIDSSGNIFAGTYLAVPFLGPIGYIYRSTDQGKEWIESTNGLPLVPFVALNFNSGSIFAGSLGKGVYRSDDEGNIWSSANDGLNYNYITAFVSNSDGELFAGTSNITDSGYSGNGVYITKNSGVDWSQANDGLLNKAVISLAKSPQGWIFAGTGGGGIYLNTTISQVFDSKSNSPKGYFLSQNYPNPFNPATTINYFVPKTSFVSIKVYNILGEEFNDTGERRKITG